MLTRCLMASQSYTHTIWYENFTVVKFYGWFLNQIDEKLLGF